MPSIEHDRFEQRLNELKKSANNLNDSIKETKTKTKLEVPIVLNVNNKNINHLKAYLNQKNDYDLSSSLSTSIMSTKSSEIKTNKLDYLDKDEANRIKYDKFINDLKQMKTSNYESSLDVLINDYTSEFHEAL